VVSGGQVSIGTGGAIVSLSDPQEEFDETLLKAQPLIEAIETVAGGTACWEPGSLRTPKPARADATANGG
jgi:hypothetical protein